MANPEHVEILKEGVDVWNDWREENPKIKPDLSGRTIKSMDLNGIDLSLAKLRMTNFVRVSLKGANLKHANMTHAIIQLSDFENAILCEADLRSAAIYTSNLSGTDFTDVRLHRTTLGDLDLCNIKNLNDVLNLGPSTIGIDTIYRSGGQIPEVFLRGCGVPESFITYMKSLTMSPIEYYSCFISHATRDAEFAERLYTDLQHKAIRCWYAPEDMKGGKKIYPQIDEAIRIHDKLVLILSESSISSPWVATEIKRTRKHEQKDERQRLFPISLVPYDELRDWELFDADTGTDLAAEIRSYFIPDFSNWKDHDSYKEAFDRLLEDLKATD